MVAVAQTGWTYLVIPGVNVNTAAGFWLCASFYAAVFLAIWLFIMLIFRCCRVSDEPFGVGQGTWALKMAMLCHHMFVGPLALMSLFVDQAAWSSIICLGCPEAASRLVRDDLPSLAAEAMVPISMGYMIADLLLIKHWHLKKGAGNQENVMMMMHHILSLSSWPTAIFYDYCSRYLLFLIATEVSSIYLTLNWFLATAGKKKSIFYIISGALFTVSFVLTRNCASVVQIIALINKPPAYSVDDVPVVLRWCGTIWLVFPHMFNTFWGFKVIKGALALVSPPKSKKV